MSTLQPAPEPTDQLRADRAFERRIWTNAEICNECYQRIKRIDLRPGKWDGREVEEHHRTDDAVAGQDDDNTGVFRPRTFCEDCGGRGHVLYQDASLDRLLGHLPTLSQRLDEEGVAHDLSALYAGVRKLKGIAAVQGQDRELVEAAVWYAVERHRGKLQTKMAFRRRVKSGEQLPDLLDPAEDDT